KRKIGLGTANLAKGPAMTREQATQAIQSGIEIAEEEIAQGVEILATGDMGIGNTTPSAAIACALMNQSPEVIVGRGTGVDDDGLKRKMDVITRALDLNKQNAN